MACLDDKPHFGENGHELGLNGSHVMLAVLQCGWHGRVASSHEGVHVLVHYLRQSSHISAMQQRWAVRFEIFDEPPQSVYCHLAMKGAFRVEPCNVVDVAAPTTPHKTESDTDRRWRHYAHLQVVVDTWVVRWARVRG